MRNKIIGVFCVSFLVCLGVSFLSYLSFTNLLESINKLSAPNEKIDLLNETFQEIILAENHFHAFVLTNDPLSEKIYSKKIENSRANIEKLRLLLSTDEKQAAQVDSLRLIFDTKQEYLEAFLKVKKRRQESSFVNEALGKISKQINDTALIEKQLRRSETLSGEIKPVEKKEVIITPDEFKGLSGFFRKLMGKNRTRFDTVSTVEDELHFTQVVRVDTAVVRDYYADTTLFKVKDILAQVMTREVNLLKLLTAKELELLQQDQAFIANIRRVVEQMKDQENVNSLNSRMDAAAMAEKSMKTILFIGVLGLLTSAVFAFLLIRDVTRSLRFRRQLENEKLRAEKLARAKEEFVSNMSHEIKTPLHSILGFTALLQNTNPNEKQKKYLRALSHSNTYLTELVENILDKAKLEAGKLQLYNEPFDMVALIEEIAAVFSYSIEEKGLKLDRSVAGELAGHYLVGDALRIKQVLNNLLSNAVKFTARGTVALRCRAKRNGAMFDLELEVSDTGRGIAEDKLSSIFDYFVQENDSIGRQYGGAGIGLSITKGLVKEMGGTIQVESRLGEGSVFRVLLSLPASAAAGHRPQPGADYAYVRFDARAMIVEDDKWNALLLKEILESRLAQVVVFSSPPGALQFLKSNPGVVSLIFTDLKMPEMDGELFLEKVKEQEPVIPIVALTAHAQPEKLKELQSKGFDHVCSKPYRPEDIERILSLYLDRPLNNTTEPGRNVEINQKPDLSFIRLFSGEKEADYERLLLEFIDNHSDKIEKFKDYLDGGDADGLATVSHQLKTVYEELQLPAVSEKLASIELYDSLGKPAMVMAYAREVYQELLLTDEMMREVRRQYCTV